MSTQGRTYIAVKTQDGLINTVMMFKTIELAKSKADDWFNDDDFDPSSDDVRVYEVEDGFSSSIGNEVYSGFYDEVEEYEDEVA